MLRKLASAAVTAGVIFGGLCAAAPAQADDAAGAAYVLKGKVLCPGGVKPTGAVAMQLKVGEEVTGTFDSKADGTFSQSVTFPSSLGFDAVTLIATAPTAACAAETKPTTVALGARVLGLNLVPALLGADVTVVLTASDQPVK
ncbi:hypothetical protein ACFXJ5_12510 [Streptomyces sp. NPDC059373]